MSFQEEKSHGQAAIAVGLAILLVYLILAALYANWILPLGVLLVIPLALFGTVAAIMLRGMDNNIYVQIGMLLLIAMSSKNALILVLYARRYGEQGMTAMQAAHKAASVRFRGTLDEVLTVHQYGVAMTILNASMRIMRISHIDMQRVLYSLTRDFDAMCRTAMRTPLEQMSNYAPMTDILAASHVKAHVRLFMG